MPDKIFTNNNKTAVVHDILSYDKQIESCRFGTYARLDLIHINSADIFASLLVQLSIKIGISVFSMLDYTNSDVKLKIWARKKVVLTD